MGNKTYTFGDIRIREVKGKYYVYIIEKDNEGNRRDNYVGKLDEVVRFYIKNAKTGVVGVSPTGVVGGVPLQASQACGPGSNPGRGTNFIVDSNNELKGVITKESEGSHDNNFEISASDLLKFELALRSKNISQETIKQYINCVKQGRKESNNCIKAWRNFYRLVLNRDPPEDLKPKKTKPDLKIPSLEEIKQTLEKAKSNNSLYMLYRILLESGIRESEALRVLNEYDENKDKCEEGICYYEINWIRGQKGSFYAFHITPIQKIKISKAYVDKYVKKLKLTPPKYFRKFVATKMAELGIPLDVIDFIQGRKPTRILTQHYVSLFGIAKEHYKKYAEWLYTTVYGEKK